MNDNALYSASRAVTIRHAVASLDAAGVNVPQDVRDAVKLSQVVPAAPTATEARQAVREATNKAELETAIEALSFRQAVLDARDGGKVTAAVAHEREAALTAAWNPHVHDLLDAVKDKFAEAAPAFVACVENLPDMASTDVLDLGPEQVDALSKARDSLAPLRTTFNAYHALVVTLGGQPGDPVRSPDRLADYIGEWSTEEDRDEAVRQVQAYGNRAALPFPALAPFIVVPRTNGVLRLR